MSGRLYVGGLSPDVYERQIEKFFKNYGRIKDMTIKRGYGFVELSDYRDAEDAVHDLNGKELMGMRVCVEFSRGGRGPNRYSSYERRLPPSFRAADSFRRYDPPSNTEFRVIIENLSSRVSWKELKDFVRQVCDVSYTDANTDRPNEGVCDFYSNSDMKRAISKLDGADLCGRRIKMIEDKSRRRGRRDSRSRDRSSSRSRSRSGSKDRSRKRRESRNSRSASPDAAPKRRDRRSSEKAKDDRDKSRSRSADRKSRSRSRSASPKPTKKRSSESPAKSPVKKKSRSRSRSVDSEKAGARSRSASASDHERDDNDAVKQNGD